MNERLFSYVSRAQLQTCSLGLSCNSCNFLTSLAKTASGGAVESIQDALIEITKCPAFFKKYCAFTPTIRACNCETVSNGPRRFRRWLVEINRTTIEQSGFWQAVMWTWLKYQNQPPVFSILLDKVCNLHGNMQVSRRYWKGALSMRERGRGFPYLIWLSDICKNDIHHGNEHPVLGRMPGILYDGNDVRSLLCHIHKISACSTGFNQFDVGNPNPSSIGSNTQSWLGPCKTPTHWVNCFLAVCARQSPKSAVTLLMKLASLNDLLAVKICQFW